MRNNNRNNNNNNTNIYILLILYVVWLGGAAGLWPRHRSTGLSESFRTLARVPGGWGGDVDHPST